MAAPTPDPAPGDPPPSTWQTILRDAGPYLHLGMQLGLSVAFFVGLGYLLDRWLGTMPWFLIGMALVGMVAAFVHLVRVSSNMNAKTPKSSREGGVNDPAKSPRKP